MKRIIILFLSFFGLLVQVKAQKIVITNTCCNPDLYLIFHADNASGCGPDVDYSLPISWTSSLAAQGGTTPVVFDFNGGTSSPGFHWNSATLPGQSSGTLSGNPFNIFQVDVFSACLGAVPGGGTCGIYSIPLDGVTVFNPNCSTPSSAVFIESWNHQCGTCCPCCPPPPYYCSACVVGSDLIYVEFTMVGSDWHIDIHM